MKKLKLTKDQEDELLANKSADENTNTAARPIRWTGEACQCQCGHHQGVETKPTYEELERQLEAAKTALSVVHETCNRYESRLQEVQKNNTNLDGITQGL